MVEMMLAIGLVAIGLGLARRQYLHPGDYLVAAALALLLAATTLIAIPDASQVRVLEPLGAPAFARSRARFLHSHGMAIVVASVACAAGYAMAALVRHTTWRER